MLAPDYFPGIDYGLMELYGRLDESIIRDIVRRLLKTGTVTDTAAWQMAKLQEAGLVYEDILAAIAKITDASQAQVKRMMQEAGVAAIAFDDEIYRLAGLSPPPFRQSPAMLQTLLAGLRKTNGLIHTLTLTTANMAQTAYINASDLAYMQVASGAFDYITAVRNAVRVASTQGSLVLYPTGHRDQLDVAVRRAVITGISQTAGQLQWARADEMGCDLVETTAHGGARPSHAAWQGQVFSRSGTHAKYPEFRGATGYGTGAGLCGWNCRHSFYPYFEGLSLPAHTQEQLREIDRPPFEYKGKKYTQYEGSQKQREFEREIRARKRLLAGYDEAVQNATDPEMKAAMQEAFDKHAVKLKEQEADLRAFLRASGQPVQGARLQVQGFGKSQAQKAVWAAKKPMLSPFDAKHLAKQDAEKLPNYQKAVIPKEKLEGYALNKNHPTGRDKAVAFEKYLGYTTDNQEELIGQVRQGLEKYQAKGRKVTQYGKPYEVAMMITGANGETARVKSGWIIDKGSDTPRLVSLYVDE